MSPLKVMFGVIALSLTAALPGWAQVAPPSPNELIPNGSFEQTNDKGEVAVWRPGAGNSFETEDGNRVLKITASQTFEWDMPNKAIWNTEYILSFRVKAEKVPVGQRLCLWTRLPDRHEPPNGPLFTPWWQGTFKWKTMSMKLKMPIGVTRFIIFFNSNGDWAGTSWLDDFSLRPVNDRPLELDTSGPSYGYTGDREQLTWIWREPGFPWQSNHMGHDVSKAVPHQKVLFRRVVDFPKGAVEPQAVFTGDDHATLLVNGQALANNQTVQNILRVPLAGRLKPGKNTVAFKTTNDFGPAGLVGRLEWKTADGKRTVLTTNGKWQCSADGGKTWKAAVPVAVVAPAPAQFQWVYPHLEKLSYWLTHDLPSGSSGARLAVRATGGVRVTADGQDIFATTSSGNTIKIDLAEKLRGKEQIGISFEDLLQPPAGQAILEVKQGEEYKAFPLAAFRRSNGSPPNTVPTVYPGKTWPLNAGAFEAAATRPPADMKGRLEPWAQKLLTKSTKIFQLGKDDDSSAEFADFAKGGAALTAPAANLKQVPRGLEGKLRPEVSIKFALAAVPAKGAALVLDVEDADALVSTVGVFVNGILCGSPQVIGYDQIPGGRLTNRAWVVTIPKERFRTGPNSLTLRLLPSYYKTDLQAVENQAEEYIKVFNLRDRKENPYPTSSWLHWDTLYLAALAQPAAEPINGRPAWMGTNLGYITFGGLAPWKDYVLRDLSYMGLEQNRSPIRIGVWDANQFGKMTATDPSLPAEQSVGDYQFSSMLDKGMRPYLLFEPGRGVDSWDDFKTSNEVKVMQRYGKYVDMLEIGNEVDHPNYGWDALKLSAAYATIQKQAVCGQALKTYDPDSNLQIMGEGWYHAWDFSMIDAQARKESESDPGWTDHLSAHNYGKSYIIPAVSYYLLYGVNAPKPIWVTECGSYTKDDVNIHDFDINLRGNLGYASYIVQYLLHPYDKEMERFSLLSAQSKEASVLEKARCYRRLMHGYALHGRPLAWQYAKPATMKDRLVLVNPVDTGKTFKISFINFSHEKQSVDVNVTLPSAGTLQATRYGDGATVEQGTRQVSLTASPAVRFQETLAPGETVEYLVRK